ncbi:MAG: thermonuclease family protein [Anaeroplasma sp.]
MKSVLRRLFLIIALVLTVCLSSCNKEKEPEDGVYSSITRKCTLNSVYENKDFISEGIGEATLVRPTDGDTATFKLVKTNQNVVIRFFGIDTPESTGSIEKWGKSASKFTAEALEKASKIVLEASTTPASVDSYGSRYLAYVWYKLNDDDQWMNLNLQVVENGYSKNKCTQTAQYKYYSYFKEAETFAKNKPLHLWDTKAEDPYYSTEAEVVTVKDLVENIDSYYNIETETGSKVRISAYIKSYSLSPSGTYTFIAAQMIEGQEYTINVYAGYASAGATSFLKVGNKYQITGSIQIYYDTVQISGLTYVPLQEGGDYLTLLEKNVYSIFNSSISYSTSYGTALYSDATVVSATENGGNIVITATATKMSDSTVENVKFIVPNTSNLSASKIAELVGKKLRTAGLKTEDGSISCRYGEIEFN